MLQQRDKWHHSLIAYFAKGIFVTRKLLTLRKVQCFAVPLMARESASLYDA